MKTTTSTTTDRTEIKSAGFTTTIEEFKNWSIMSVRDCCIRNGYYTCGTNEDYDHMLSWVTRLYPNTENIYFIAKDIYDHSDWKGYDDYSQIEKIQSIMFNLKNEAVHSTYEIF